MATISRFVAVSTLISVSLISFAEEKPSSGGPGAGLGRIQPPAQTDGKSGDAQLIAEAKERATEGKLAEALDIVERYRQAKGETAQYFELKGTVLTLGKDYEAAEKAFGDLLLRAPDSYVGRFNRAETMMLLGRYAKAESEFAIVERDQSALAPPIADLARFKRVACFLAQGKMLEASGLVPPVKEAKESPALFYSRMMVAWVRKDANEANRLLAEARKNFSREVDDLYTDTFVELRWGTRGMDGQFNFGLKFR